MGQRLQHGLWPPGVTATLDQRCMAGEGLACITHLSLLPTSLGVKRKGFRDAKNYWDPHYIHLSYKLGWVRASEMAGDNSSYSPVQQE